MHEEVEHSVFLAAVIGGRVDGIKAGNRVAAAVKAEKFIDFNRLCNRDKPPQTLLTEEAEEGAKVLHTQWCEEISHDLVDVGSYENYIEKDSV